MPSSSSVATTTTTAASPPSQRRLGQVKFFNSTKGYGFIIPTEKPIVEVFVHHTAILGDGFKSLAEGEEVEYDLIQGPKGMQAANVSGPAGAPVLGDPNARRPYPRYQSGYNKYIKTESMKGTQQHYGYAVYGIMPAGYPIYSPGPYPHHAMGYYGCPPPPPLPPGVVASGTATSPSASHQQHAAQTIYGYHHHHHQATSPPGPVTIANGSDTSAPTSSPSLTSVIFTSPSPAPGALAMYYPYAHHHQPYYGPLPTTGMISTSSSSTSSNQTSSTMTTVTTATVAATQDQPDFTPAPGVSASPTVSAS
ncbi:cold-shock' DNA-binding domain-containing protein [Dichotomocladium elegans]|nr:cold-shock' DNA-binding domain-containing protein [Dichotomocladium elegans]